MYSARITRNNPTAFVFLIDRSGSMEESIRFGNTVTTKAEAVAKVTNMMIREIVNRCKREEGIMDYFDVAAIGYSGDEAEFILGDEAGFVKPSVLALSKYPVRTYSRERRLPDGRTIEFNEHLRYWVEPSAGGNTPMLSALEQAYLLTSRWCRRRANRSSYPPTIFNITDGEATDGDHQMLMEMAEQIRSLSTDDGNVLLFNINITGTGSDRTVLFPRTPEELPDSRYARTLFEMSSPMPAEYNTAIANLRSETAVPSGPYKGMSLNTSVPALIAMMNIGSRSITKMM